MEVKINKDIKEYVETIYFGLSIRQFVCSILACISSIIIYFLLKPYLSMEFVSWSCVIVAFPFVAMGFLKYNGMPAEKFIVAWVKSEILIPKKLKFKPNNYYKELLDKKSKERKLKRNEKNKKYI